MNQNLKLEKSDMISVIETINQVEGFDPTPFAADFCDLDSGRTMKYLPVMPQIAWFRLKYPEGKIAVNVVPGKDGVFIANAKVYPNYKDPQDHYLAEGTASRSYMPDKPTVSPREWAQTAAVGIALRNAGFGLQFAVSGEEFEPVQKTQESTGGGESTIASPTVVTEGNVPEGNVEMPKELTEEEKLMQAMNCACPIAKYAGKTLGEVLPLDPTAIKWVATKYTGNDETKAAAIRICEHALSVAGA